MTCRCGLCAQYVTALRRATTALASVSSTTLSTTSDQTPPLYILLISSGSPSLIPIYRSRLECPFPLYVDQRRQTYKALGMTLKSLSAGKEKDKGSCELRSPNLTWRRVDTGKRVNADSLALLQTSPRRCLRMWCRVRR